MTESHGGAKMFSMLKELGSNRSRLLDLLSDGEWHSQHECVEAGGLRYGARIKELREQGHRIETRDLPGSPRRFFYRLRLPDQGSLFT